jgi:hypothetical protein
MIKGLPITAFKDGDILLNLDETNDQWLFRNGELEKITNVASDFEIRKPLSGEMFYKMESSTGDTVVTKLHQAYTDEWITERNIKNLKKC